MLAPILAMAFAAAPRIAVMPITPGAAVSAPEAAALTEALVSEVRRRSGAEVITQAEVTSILNMEQQKRMLGCSTDACMAELGGALGVGRLVTGTAAKLGESLLVHLRVLDSARVKVVAQSDRRVKKGTYDDVLDALPAMVSELFPPEPAAAVTPAPAATPAPRAAAAPSGPARAALVPASGFRPPQGMFAIHVRATKDLGLMAWVEEPGMDRTKVFRRYVTKWGDFMLPSGTTDFGMYWLLPAAEFKSGTATFAFLAPSRFHGNGERPEAKLGNGCCGQMTWALADSAQVWIDPVECRPRRTVDEALRAGK